MQLLKALRNAAGRLAHDFEDSKLFTHSGDKGEFREAIIGKFLRPFLPTCYGIGSGQVFSSDGSASDQVDVVLYDEVFSNVLFRDSRNSLFPCEAVYGLIEVKSVLSTAELESSITNIESVKKLARSPSDMLDLLPFRRLNVGAGLNYDKQARNPYFGVVFAYDGLTVDTVLSTLLGHLTTPRLPREQLPDFVFLYKRGATIIRTRREGDLLLPAPPGAPFDTYAAIPSGGDTLPLFFLTLNTVLNGIILKAVDHNAYWTQVVDEIQKKARQS